MKYKLPRPSDSTQDGNFVYRLADAYSKLSGDYLEILVTIDNVIEALGDEDHLSREWGIKKLNELADKYKDIG